MNYKIVTDSSSNLVSLPGVAYATVPMKIMTREREYVDAPGLNIEEMVEDLRKQTEPTSSSCPNAHEWLNAFEGADAIFALTISSSLSGSYSAAMLAREEYLGAHPEAKVCVIDTQSAGPEMHLLCEKIRSSIQAGKSFEQIEADVRAYMKHTHILYALQSLANLARNGRVNPAVAKIAGVLGICVLGKASSEGTIQLVHKCRGIKKLLRTITSEMQEMGFTGGNVRITHCLNPEAAEQLKEALLDAYPSTNIEIANCTALCSYYAEKGGLLVGFEDSL